MAVRFIPLTQSPNKCTYTISLSDLVPLVSLPLVSLPLKRKESESLSQRSASVTHVILTYLKIPATNEINMPRKFYEDDEIVITKPGYNTAISDDLKEQESTHEVKFVQGMAIRTTPILEKYLNSARVFLHENLVVIESELATQVSAARNEINSINDTIQSLLKEPVLPNLIYILTFTLSASILSARRSLPLRFLAPTTFGIGATSYFMPKTFQIATDQLADYERAQFPEIYKTQSQIIKELEVQTKKANKSINSLNSELANKIHDARIYLSELNK